MFNRKKRQANTESRVKRGYAKLGRIAHKTASPFLRAAYSEKHVRVRVLICNEDGEMLLTRSWFGHQKWSLPGGGIKRNETPAEAAVREVHEETGIRLAIEDLHELGTFPYPDEKRKYNIACYKVDMPKRPPKVAHHRRLETLDVSWFPVANPPRERSLIVDMAVALVA
jgi:8-oxo-dGTP diphosphatase